MVNPRIELNLWLANHEVNLRVEQPALSLDDQSWSLSIPYRHIKHCRPTTENT